MIDIDVIVNLSKAYKDLMDGEISDERKSLKMVYKKRDNVAFKILQIIDTIIDSAYTNKH